MSVLLVAHGSRDSRFALRVTGIRDAVRAAVPTTRVELAYLDLNEPLVGTVLDELAQTGEPVTVIPLLLGDGYHSRFDLPVLLDAARRRWPAVEMTQSPVLGSADLTGSLADRVRAAGLRTGDGIVMYAVGSSDERSDDAARRRGAELGRHLGHPVEVVFATKLGPDGFALRDAIDRLRTTGAGRVVGLPYFLSPGLLTERVEALIDEHAPGSPIAGALGSHELVVGAIVALIPPAPIRTSRRNPVGKRGPDREEATESAPARTR
ncbi:putative ferrochelatase [Gordonia araii NBRC 100433]|uniref:Putative ferrochelatase n=1 Tax=Gordonia araii NBRC 100433 TaxID=1073574 RepID=G7H4J2_9ACTN|nr:sirohydrochlorin chelatase [Gordonia araii]NNG96176.1 sirohydrochlorin chelatase [Gordonia araii NBRC 100433]GAB10767.1 putative ferrochelatase [Gordonia araii NBRC 100433]